MFLWRRNESCPKTEPIETSESGIQSGLNFLARMAKFLRIGVLNSPPALPEATPSSLRSSASGRLSIRANEVWANHVQFVLHGFDVDWNRKRFSKIND